MPALTACLVGCAAVDKQVNEHEWMRKTRDASVKAANVVTGTASRTAKRMQDYLARKDVLQTFTDAADHSEAAVLDVLRKAGVQKTPAASQPTPKTPTTKSPAPTPSATVAKATFPARYQGTYRWPVDAGIVSSEYGSRHGRPHRGIDIAGDVGEPILAVASGDVIYAGNGMSGYGNVVILRHDQATTSLYAHNSELKVQVGDRVRQGEHVALLGNAGHSTGPHVHFELREGETPVDPRARLLEGALASVAHETTVR
jgi:murein DD-endopeptidase MepM/ murein hydrolase activator NlpD